LEIIVRIKKHKNVILKANSAKLNKFSKAWIGPKESLMAGIL